MQSTKIMFSQSTAIVLRQSPKLVSGKSTDIVPGAGPQSGACAKPRNIFLEKQRIVCRRQSTEEVLSGQGIEEVPLTQANWP